MFQALRETGALERLIELLREESSAEGAADVLADAPEAADVRSTAAFVLANAAAQNDKNKYAIMNMGYA